MSNYYLGPDGRVYSEEELYHYGVLGMKWGVRRYRNSDGTLTSEGRKRAKAEYKEDNAKAFELGKNATLYGHASMKAIHRTKKIEKKLNKQYEKDPEGTSKRTQSLLKKWTASSNTAAEFAKAYAESRDAAEAHCKSLVDKYGKEAVSSIKYKDVKLSKAADSGSNIFPDSIKVMNERTNKLSSYAAAGAVTLASVAFNAVGATPLAVLMIPKSAKSKAAEMEASRYYENLSEIKRGK